LESQKERDHYEDLDIGVAINLQWILEWKNRVAWTGLIVSGYGPMQASSEHDIEHSGSIRFWEILD
jgi:hypothetical protein